MYRKTLVSVLCLAVASVILLAGCSSKKENKGDPSPGSSATQSGGSKESVTIRIGVIGDTLKGVEQLAKTYESQNENVKIAVERAPNDQYQSGLLAGLAGQDAPDIFQYWGGNVFKKLAVNHADDLTGLSIVSNVDSSALEAFTVDGKVLGIPFGIEFTGVYYNKQIFKDNGWKIPTSWDEFLTLCEAVKAKGMQPLAFMGKEPWEVQMPWFQMAPTVLYSKQSDWDQQRYDNQVKFAGTDGWKELASRYKLMLDNGYLGKDILGVSYDQAKQLFSTGKAPMILDGTWALGNYKDMVKQSNMDIGMFAFPANAPGQDLWLSKSTSTGLAVWVGSKHKEEVKRFYEFIYSDDKLMQLIGQGNIPSFKTVTAETDPILADIMPIAKNNKSYRFLDAGWPTGPSDEAFTKETQAALGGVSTFDKVLEVADKSWDKGASEDK